MPDGPLSPTSDGVRVAIRLTPRAKVDRVIAVAAAAGGRQVLKASVTQPPAKGRANEALLRLLASLWQLPRRDLAIVAGATNRDKTVQITGDPLSLLAHLRASIAALPKV